FDQHVPDVGIAGLGNSAPVVTVSARILRGDQPRVPHKSARRGEAPEIAKLGHQDNGCGERDAAERLQHGDQGGKRTLGGQEGELRLQIGQTVLGVVDGLQIIPQHHLMTGMREADRKSTRLNSSHEWISYAVFCLKKKKKDIYKDSKYTCNKTTADGQALTRLQASRN